MATVHWVSGSGGNWSTAVDWSGSAVPTSTDDVVIDATATGAGGYTVDVDGADTANSLGVIAGAIVQINAGETLALAAGTGAGVNAGTVAIGDAGTLSAAGTFDNTSLIAVQGGADVTALDVSGAALTLTGGGSVALIDGGQSSQIAAATAGNTLVNVDNTISGAGVIGTGGLAVDNQAAGVIDANDADRLTLDTTGTFTNAGLIVASGGGGLQIAAGTTIDNTGTILANGGNVYLDGAVSGGTLSAPDGTLEVEANTTATLADVALTGASPLTVNNTGTLNLQGAIANAGTIVVGAYESGPLFVAGSTFQVQATDSPDTFTTTVTLTPGTVPLDNGTLDLTIAIVPDGPDDWLTFTYNTTNGALLSQGGDWSVYETGLDAAEPVNFINAYLQMTSGGTVDTPTGDDIFGGSFIPNPVPGQSGNGFGGNPFTDLLPAGPVPALGTYIHPWDDLDNTGIDSSTVTGYEETLEFAPQTVSTTIPSQLMVSAATATLSGNGVVQLVDNGTLDQIGAITFGNELVNVDNVIVGAGLIGAGGLALDNQAAGIIDADATDQLVINTNGAAVSNEGFMESTSGGGLQITGGTTIDNTGTILADGGNVYLDNATIFGGTLSGPAGSFIVDSGDSATLSDATVAAGTSVTVSNSATLDLATTVASAATIDVTGSNAFLVLGNQIEQSLAAPAPDSFGGAALLAASPLTLPSLPHHL